MKGIRQLNNLCGIDVGCTNIKMVAIVNNQIKTNTIPSGDFCSKEYLVNQITEFYLTAGPSFNGLGIAFSGCTTDGQSICQTTLNCLKNLCTKDFTHLMCPKINLINDSNASCLAGTIEYPESKVLVSVTSGTGIGAGIAINSKLFTGANGFAGEIYGNTTFDKSGSLTKIGRLCSGSKILKKLRSTDNSQIDAIITEAAQELGIVLVSLIHSFNPDVIYLSGGGFEFYDLFSQTTSFIKKHAYPQFLEDITIVKSGFNNYAGCYGAMKSLVM